MPALLPVNLLAVRRSRSGLLPGLLVCLGLLGVFTFLDWHGGGAYASHRYVILPLCASLLIGAWPAVAFSAISVAQIAWATFHTLDQVSPLHRWYNIESAMEVVVVCGLSVVYETSRRRAEQAVLELEQEKAASAEAKQARIARHQALRADLNGAFSDQGTLAAALQRCCEAVAFRLDVAFARIWILDAKSGVITLQARAGEDARLDAPPSHDSVGQLASALIVRERRPYITNDVPGDALVEDRDWASRHGFVAFAGHPLLAKGRVLGVVTVYSARPLNDETLAVLGSGADIIAHGIERKRAEEELAAHVQALARSNRELEQFAYIASHDLQEPLRMVASYTQLLARRYRGKLDASADEFIDFAVEGANRMHQLINDLLAYSRVNARGRTLTPVDPGLMIESVLRGLEPAIQESGARVTVDPLPVVQADGSQLAQLIRHLLVNALKFRAAGVSPRIHVSARQEGDEWVFSVQDNGIGIEPEFFERIFIVFQRLHPRSRYPGTGVGLAICKKIVERHGGRIWVRSLPGQGATFYFTLPARRATGAAVVAAASLQNQRSSSSMSTASR